MRSTARLARSPAIVTPFKGASRAAALMVARRRTYVTETKRDNARVETAIKLDKKDFADIPPPMMEKNTSDIKVSPMAGT